MRIRALPFLLLLASLAPTAPVFAQSTPSEPVLSVDQARLSASDAIVLGLVEGVTEFLPISSTGHLIIANRVLGLDSDAQLVDANGQPLWHRRPSEKNPAGEPLTVKLAADTYTVVIQAGAIAAVAILYWPSLLAMLGGLSGRNADGGRLLRNVLLAFVPVAVVGLAAHNWIDEHLFSIGAVTGSLVAGAVLMLWAEHWRKKRAATSGETAIEPATLPARSALGIGFFQCLALWPGTSRSMVTIVGGYLAGLNPVKAAEFSFLVGLPVLGGAAFYKSIKSGAAMITVFGWSHVLLGAAVAAVSAALAVKFLVRLLSRHGLAAFAWYRLALAAVLAATHWL